MPSPEHGPRATPILVDTNVIIEAVRTNSWNALTGGAPIETVEECREEALRGDAGQAGFVTVNDAHLDRLARVHAVTPLTQATFALAYSAAATMDAGERDLFAHAFEREHSGDGEWYLSSSDKALIRAAVSLDWSSRLQSLEEIMERLGTRPRPSLLVQHSKRWLSQYRTQYLMNP